MQQNSFNPYKRNLIIVYCLFVLTLIPVSDDGVYFLTGLLATTSITVFLYGVVIAYLLRFRILQRIYRWAEYEFNHTKKAVFLSAIFFTFLLTCILVSYRVFQFYPSVIDSIDQYLQAKFLAAGYVTVPMHPLQRFFSQEHFIEDGRLYAQYPLGHIALLALGHLVGLPWLINPLQGAATCVVLYFLAREMFSETVARLTALLAAISPFLRDMSSEYMNHPTALLCLTLFTLYFIKATKSGKFTHGLIMGLSVGYAFITRPYTAVVYAIPVALYGIWLGVKEPARFLKCYTTAVISFILVTEMQFFYNSATTGNPLLYGYLALYGVDHSPGFHAIPEHFVLQMQATQHTFWRGIKKAFKDINALQIFLFGWPMPSLTFVGAAYVLGRRKVAKYLYLLLAICLSAGASNIFYFYSDWCFGPRYLYEISGLLAILTAYGLTQIPLIVRKMGATQRMTKYIRQWFAWMVLGCFLASVFLGSYVVVNTQYCWAPTPFVPQLQEKHLHNALVFVNASYNQYQELAAYYHPIEDSNDIIVARDLGDVDDAVLMRYYPHRTVYRWSYTETGPDRSQLGWFFGEDNSNISQSFELLRKRVRSKILKKKAGNRNKIK